MKVLATAFSLDFNLKAHMKTHFADNYHMCPYPECGRRFTQESKLRAHFRAQHEKTRQSGLQNPGGPVINRNALGDHPHNTAKSLVTPPVPSADRPYVCPYDGCAKAYIHEYKLNLHLKKEHPNHYSDAGAQAGPSRGTILKNSRRSKPNLTTSMPLAKIPKRSGYTVPSPAVSIPEEHQWPRKVLYEDDSEETEEEGDNLEEVGLRYRAASGGDDDEETEEEE
ncbi:unnamed protein product [Triticum turgidum subsp. durum]|uniref:C2H2-type domain-containing protein n=1 Tax=Triticum turgidum subsp. durum TaxID=4567 RepID=A0A9R1AZU0_TRITD|nr:unnamed protein product [Triticum turgidum subsp. durum]